MYSVFHAAQFGVLSFSSDEKKLLFVAGKKKPKTASFFESKSKFPLCAYVRACVCACLRACVRLCLHACVRACVCVCVQRDTIVHCC